MKRVIIHIGIPKTGSTAIQRFLADNSLMLAEMGIGVYNSKYIYPHNLRIANAAFLLADQAAFEKADLVDEENSFSEFSERSHNLVLSDEVIYEKGCHDPAVWKKLQERVQSLVQGDVVIDIVVYLRRQDEWIVSRWKHKILMARRKAVPFTEYLELCENERFLNYDIQLRHLENVFGREHVIVQVYNRALFAEGDVCHDFLSAIGIRWEDRFASPKRLANPSLTMSAAEALRVIWEESKKTDAEIRKIQQAAITFSHMVPETEAYFPMEPSERKSFVEQYEKGNRWIAERYWNGASFLNLKTEEYQVWKSDPERDMRNAEQIRKLASLPGAKHIWIREHSKKKWEN